MSELKNKLEKIIDHLICDTDNDYEAIQSDKDDVMNDLIKLIELEVSKGFTAGFNFCRNYENNESNSEYVNNLFK